MVVVAPVVAVVVVAVAVAVAVFVVVVVVVFVVVVVVLVAWLCVCVCAWAGRRVGCSCAHARSLCVSWRVCAGCGVDVRVLDPSRCCKMKACIGEPASNALNYF